MHVGYYQELVFSSDLKALTRHVRLKIGDYCLMQFVFSNLLEFCQIWAQPSSLEQCAPSLHHFEFHFSKSNMAHDMLIQVKHGYIAVVSSC